MTTHNEKITRQFTKQAKGFARATSIKDKTSIDQVLKTVSPRKEDEVLDVACGPGILSCAFAEKTKQATGIDLVPAMLDQAQKLQENQGLFNLSWDLGDVYNLPYKAGSFSIVTCRYSFHHFKHPEAALQEMKRVCRPSGKIVVIDMLSSEDAEKANAFNAMEKLRDDSHDWALAQSEMQDLFGAVDLAITVKESYELGNELHSFLNRSFPEKGNRQKIKERLEKQADHEDFLGIKAERIEDTVKFSYPVGIFVGLKK